MRDARLIDEWLAKAARDERARIVAGIEEFHRRDDPSPRGREYADGWHDAFIFCEEIARRGGDYK